MNIKSYIKDFIYKLKKKLDEIDNDFWDDLYLCDVSEEVENV